MFVRLTQKRIGVGQHVHEFHICNAFAAMAWQPTIHLLAKKPTTSQLTDTICGVGGGNSSSAASLVQFGEGLSDAYKSQVSLIFRRYLIWVYFFILTQKCFRYTVVCFSFLIFFTVAEWQTPRLLFSLEFPISRTDEWFLLPHTAATDFCFFESSSLIDENSSPRHSWQKHLCHHCAMKENFECKWSF